MNQVVTKPLHVSSYETLICLYFVPDSIIIVSNNRLTFLDDTFIDLIAVGWGLGTGQKWASDRMVLLLVLPPDQNAELMGIYVFFRQVLSWLPPLVFTILNERGVEQRYGILTLTIYFVLSFLACIQILRSKPDVRIADDEQNGNVESSTVEQEDDIGNSTSNQKDKVDDIEMQQQEQQKLQYSNQ